MRHKGQAHDETVSHGRLPTDAAPKRRRTPLARASHAQQKLTAEQFASQKRGTVPALLLRIRRAHGGHRREQGRTPMANAIDLHVGKRLRRRRRLLGLTQQQLAESIGIRFQQIQKYECGANRVTASRLYELAVALNVPVNYFFDGLQAAANPAAPGAPANIPPYRVFPGHKQRAWHVTFAPDGTTAYSCGDDGFVRKIYIFGCSIIGNYTRNSIGIFYPISITGKCSNKRAFKMIIAQNIRV